jgi:hypothetical protein
VNKSLELKDRGGAAKVIAGEPTARARRTQIDIRALKQSVASNFGSHSLIGKVMLVEPDLIPVVDIVGKVGTWLAVLREDSGS